MPLRFGGEIKIYPPYPPDMVGNKTDFPQEKYTKKTSDSKSAAGEKNCDLVCDRMMSLAAAGENFDYFEAGNTIF